MTSSAGPNIAIVVLDTLRKDAFDEYFDWLPGTRYEQAWSTSNWTVPAHASLFTGEYPSTVETHAKRKVLDHDAPTLAESLQAEEYRTRGISANVHVSSAFDFDRGFDEFYELGWRACRRVLIAQQSDLRCHLLVRG
ncbi:sulfatase-like hydrolase/transferase [Halapricum desulfuricans]|uniref:Arylsulfatase A or related enzyme n=1 Tax=Halapricum desulfuricans TaxID=2841257 RepID=A0A897NB75_9EURY|nr:sulfatase-like hydrolase/transferase [Halapricum desulfuricans]QSG08239.1 Arylsulfatase A or related enzyme [Halapricum desulfuricans]